MGRNNNDFHEARNLSQENYKHISVNSRGEATIVPDEQTAANKKRKEIEDLGKGYISNGN